MPAPKNIKITPGDCNFAVEAARGELSYYLVGDGTGTPYRLKIRVPSYSNLSCLQELSQGILLPDLVSIMDRPLEAKIQIGKV